MGKSSLLTELTGTESEAAAYEFTTLTCIPGVIHYNESKIQLLDLPGIIEGAAQGKGRGRQVRCGPVLAARQARPFPSLKASLPACLAGCMQPCGAPHACTHTRACACLAWLQVIAVCKSADLLLMVLDATKPLFHKTILTRELESVGIRLNRSPPNIYYKFRKTGGRSINSTLALTHMDDKMIERILQVRARGAWCVVCGGRGGRGPVRRVSQS